MTLYNELCRLCLSLRVLKFKEFHLLRQRCSTNVTNAGSLKKATVDLSKIPTDKIRNFSIIAHVDHGKSTLADRLLEITGAIERRSSNEQVLDRLPVERERGITVKAQTASLLYDYDGSTYLLNLIDTPGHVDFNYEVSRSISACQGVILLVDANQGVQAQTVANFYLAFAANLVVIPVLNKIDLKNAKPDAVSKQICTAFDFSSEDILRVSAKLGHGCEELLQAIIKLIPPPSGSSEKPFRSLVFDSWYDRYRGVIPNIAVIDGSVRVGDEIVSAHTGKVYEIKDVGVMAPDETSTRCLFAGQVGYVSANMRNIKEVQVGDTFYTNGKVVSQLPGFRVAKPMVFAGVFPVDQSQTPTLRQAIEKLTLNDSSVSISLDSSPALGQGWRLGFLGLLHMDVFSQRLEQEYDAQVVITAPNVPYKAKITGAKNIKKFGSDEIFINNPLNFPDTTVASEYFEPMVRGTIITPQEYLGKVIGLCMERRGIQLDSKNLDEQTVIMDFRLPLNEIVIDFFDELKTLSSGYASFDYEEAGYESASLVKLTVKLNGNEVEEMTTIVHSSRARTLAKFLCSRLKETIPQQQFVVAIQVCVGGTVLARENLKALRKDVTAKLYGGDVTRRMKLLNYQKEGKKRLRMIGNIALPRDTFIKVLRK